MGLKPTTLYTLDRVLYTTELLRQLSWQAQELMRAKGLKEWLTQLLSMLLHQLLLLAALYIEIVIGYYTPRHSPSFVSVLFKNYLHTIVSWLMQLITKAISISLILR